MVTVEAGGQGRRPIGRLVLPIAAVLLAVALVCVAGLRWNDWVGGMSTQVTDDAYVRAHITRLSVRIAGQVRTVAVDDFESVRAGDLLVQIDDSEFAAIVAQAEASVAAARAALENLTNQIELQYAAIAQAEAAKQAAVAREIETRQEEERQKSLVATLAGTKQKLEQAVSAHARAEADVKASEAFVEVQKHQLDVLNGTKQQRAADLLGAQAALTTANLKLSYTRIVAPFDGFVSERQVQPGDYVNVGSNLISVVPIPELYVIANYKETQLTKVRSGQRAEISVDAFPGASLRGRVERIAPASGSQFALLPPDNATGNFTKVVERLPVRIAFDADQPLVRQLRPGMSVITRIYVDKSQARAERRASDMSNVRD
ncbi:HlyD family secretion protein [Bradyrhizobium sp. STM 3557]|uniref:HlyD family secretion protein n=1 Tax=Bradyrhizobium sp. STM 3557 TaxID=578920 RepID=UPI00388F53F0